MAKKVKRKTTDTWKKKQWYSIVSPKEWDAKEIAETPSNDDKKLINRIIKIPLREITGNMKHQFVKVAFRVTEVKGLTAHTELDGFEMVREYLKRNVRRRRSMIRTIQNVKTRDKKTIRITSYLFTARKIDTTKKDKMRNKMAEVLQNQKKETLDSLVKKCLFGQISIEIAKSCKEISPVKRVELAKGKVIRENK